MQIYVFNQQKDLSIKKPQIKQLVNQVIAFEGHDYGEVSVYFVPTNAICELHQQYFNDPSSTDCISFPLEDESHQMLGDVFVCPATAIQYAKKKGLDPYHELSLYIVHGLLHLMGYDDLNPKDKRKMRQAEKRHIENLASLDMLL